MEPLREIEPHILQKEACMKIICRLTQQFGPLLGRVLLANIFLVSGFYKLTGFGKTAGVMTAKMSGIPPDLITVLLVVTIAVELGGGLMLLLGWKARWAATAIFLWMIPVTYVFHAYWAVPPEQMQMQFIQFQKNLAIMGGLLFVAAMGPGAYRLGRDDC